MLSSSTVLRLVDSVAIVLSQAYQLARARLASAASPVLRMMMQRDHAHTETELLRREIAILRGQRENARSHQRSEYSPEQRLAIVQLKRLRGWTLAETAARFVVHENTLRHWIHAIEGGEHTRLLAGAIVWNKIDDVVRWAVHELQRLCPESEFGTRSIARQLVKVAVQISRSSVQRILRETKPEKPRTPATRKPAMEEPVGIKPHHLLLPQHTNHVWHMDLTCIRVLWFTFYVAAILDGFSRKLLALRVYRRMPRAFTMLLLVRNAIKQYGRPRFLITDHGSQFRRRFHTALKNQLRIHHVRSRVRAPYLNGKMERAFRPFKQWWRGIWPCLSLRLLQRRLENYRCWYNGHRIHSALGVLTPQEAWDDESPPTPITYRAREQSSLHMAITRSKCRGDTRLRVLSITLRHAA